MSRPDARPPDAQSDDRPARSVGLVLGAGGGAGWAWMVGCLAALDEVAGWDARVSDLIVGTSAGAGVGATLRAGLGPLDQLAQYRGEPLSAEGEALVARTRHIEAGHGAPANTTIAPANGTDSRDGANRPDNPAVAATAGLPATAGVPGPPGDRPGGRDDDPAGRRSAESHSGADSEAGTSMGNRPASPSLALRSLGHWPPRAGLAVAGMQRRGQRTLGGLGRRLDALGGGTWPENALWVTAVRVDNGRRVVFGRDGIDPGRVGTAVEASSAVPGCYAPVRIAGHDYVDGAVWSASNADLVAGLGFDLALVLAPLSVTSTRLSWDGQRLRRTYHRSVLSREVNAVHRNGTDVVVLEPKPDDVALLTIVGGELDDDRRRAIAECGRQRTIERLAEDASLAPLSSPARESGVTTP